MTAAPDEDGGRLSFAPPFSDVRDNARRPPESHCGRRSRPLTFRREGVVTRRQSKIALVLAAQAVAVTALAVPASAARQAGGREADLQRSLDQLVAAGVPGAVLFVRKGDRTIRLTSGYGNLRPKTPMRA